MYDFDPGKHILQSPSFHPVVFLQFRQSAGFVGKVLKLLQAVGLLPQIEFVAIEQFMHLVVEIGTKFPQSNEMLPPQAELTASRQLKHEKYVVKLSTYSGQRPAVDPHI